MNCYRRLPKPKSSYGMKGYLLDVSCAPVHWIIGENRMKKIVRATDVELLAAVRLAAELIVLPAAETPLLRTFLHHPRVGQSVLLQVADQLAIARLAVEPTALHAVV